MSAQRIVLLALLLGAMVIGCKKEDNGPTNPPSSTGGGLTDAEKQLIRAGFAGVSPSADSILKTANPLAGFQAKLASYQANPNVSGAWITNNALFVQFKGGGIVSWYIKSDLIIPPYDGAPTLGSDSPCLLKPSEQIGNTNVLLINAQAGDESRQYNRDVITFLTGRFQNLGFTVTTKNGPDANVSLFKSGLKQYGAIFYIAHGAYDGTVTWQTTGQGASLEDVMANYPTEWRARQIGSGSVSEKRGGRDTVVSLYLFSNRFIDSMYTATDFPSSMIYLVACQGMKSGQLGPSFVNKGAHAVIGWDETNCLGQSTGKKLFDILLCGKNVRDAMADLPAEAKHDRCEVAAGANLVSYPPAGDTLRLVQESHGTLLIDFPHKDSTYTTRTLTLSGSLIQADTINSGTLEVNGIATVLKIGADYRSFSQQFAIQDSLNTIHITCKGKLLNGKCAVVDTVFPIYGRLGVLDLWTELRWNTNGTDIDFHLVPPGGSIATLWTSNDCYYSNSSPSWGGVLDFDNTSGYGPEHITLPKATTPGDYHLFVHFYADHGGGSSSAFVSVSVRNGPIQPFGPYQMVNPGVVNGAGGNGHGDVWEVCTITFPAGTVTPVNQLTTLPPPTSASREALKKQK
jgi:uncharacterized protein YfaP (DUF2135 family)